MLRISIILLTLLASLASAQNTHVYVGTLDATSVTLVWGTTSGITQNTIGHAAQSSGAATVRLGSQTLTTSGSWIRVTGLIPETA